MEPYYPIIQERMQTASFRSTMSNMYYPFRRYDEVFRRVSDIIPELEDYYWISCFGRVYNEKLGYLVTTSYNHQDYEIVSLRRKQSAIDSGKQKYWAIGVHILVCLAFIGPKPGTNYQVNHKNFIRDYNEWDNLEWMSSQNNLDYSRAAGHYWNGESYSSSKYPPEKIHELCRLLESGITDPDTLSMMVFGEHVSPKYYSLIQDMRTGSNWSHISSKYNIPRPDKRNFTDDTYIHMMCKYFSEHPGSITNSNITLADILTANGLNPNTMDPKVRHKLSSALNQLRYKGAYKRIISQYTIT